MSIEDRVASLEQENRRLRSNGQVIAILGGFWLALVTLGVVVGMVRLNNPPSYLEVAAVRANSLSVGNGNSSLVINDAGDGAIRLSMFKDGKPIVLLSAGEGGGGMIDAFNPLGERVATVQSNPENAGGVYVFDAKATRQNSLVPRYPVEK